MSEGVVDPEHPACLTVLAQSELALGGAAAAKTVRKLVNERTSTRMQERGHAAAATPPPRMALRKYAPSFVLACRRLFEGCERDAAGASITVAELMRLATQDAFAVDPRTLETWLQRPRVCDSRVAFAEFVDACYGFYGPALETRVRDLSPAATRGDHPFTTLCSRDADARQFSAVDHIARRNPMKAQREHDAQRLLARSKSELLKATGGPVLRTSASAICLAKDEEDVAQKRRKVQQQRDDAVHTREAMQAKLAMARHFGSNVGMVARHIQIGEIAEQRHLYAREKKAHFEHAKQENEQATAHLRTFNTRTKLTKIEHAMSARHDLRDQIAATHEKKKYREELLRRHKALFNLSESTCTLHRRPPELLAALSRAHTEADVRRLAKIEQRFFEQNLSQQLREYKHDKEHALKTLPHAPVPAAMVHLDQQDESHAWENPEAQLTAAMDALLQEWIADQRDLSCLVPMSNTPPAALRYFGKARDLPPKPFLSSTERL
ncbi:hypothetical protein ACHHYP_10197 [Achlya hypogyna]|uniref:Uncharacterized protein n=1 Tax=Achlya hypogyna TaxID=1202772 RepID=A0A1V9ZI65_ACHHY|nr:hypothetical protein ACHHYP_10197 [Achlya hypogyna]